MSDKRTGPGRPKKEIDEKLLEQLASIQCSLAEMASIMDCHPDTLRDNFSTVIDKGRESGKMSLRRKQFSVALSGNVTMLIWLGKQYLGQDDKNPVVSVQTSSTQVLSKDDVIDIVKRARIENTP